MKGFHVSASGAIQGHHGPVFFFFFSPSKLDENQKAVRYKNRVEMINFVIEGENALLV